MGSHERQRHASSQICECLDKYDSMISDFQRTLQLYVPNERMNIKNMKRLREWRTSSIYVSCLWDFWIWISTWIRMDSLCPFCLCLHLSPFRALEQLEPLESVSRPRQSTNMSIGYVEDSPPWESCQYHTSTWRSADEVVKFDEGCNFGVASCTVARVPTISNRIPTFSNLFL